MTTSSAFLASDGAGYEALMGRWSKRLAPLFIDFAGISAAESVLDVGCGTGSLTFALARNPRISAVEGVDLSPIYVEYASQQSRDSRVRFRVADACALPFADASFDHTLSSLVLQFIPNADQALRELKRVARVAGTVGAATWNTQDMVIHRMFFETAAEIDPRAKELRAAACARPMSRADGLAKAWCDCGLTNVSVDSLAISMDYACFDDFWLPLTAKDGPYADYYRTLDAERKARLRERLQAVYFGSGPDGPRSYPATAWAVKGKVA